MVAPDASVGEVRDLLAGHDAGGARIQLLDGEVVRIRSDIDDPARAAAIRETLTAELGVVETFEQVGPTWGDEVTDKAVRALIVFFVVVALYISVRLEWKMAVGALVAVAHDIVVSVGVYSLLGVEVTPATVIAFLTIMGYSLYDTIVVYDKVREMTGRLGATERHTYTELMNLALNRVAMRSVNTSITSALPVLSLLVVGSVALGATALREFALALLVGIVVGSYSSLFVAAALVARLKEREQRWAQVRSKLDGRGLLEGPTRPIGRDEASVPESRSIESWRIVSVWPVVPSTISWWATMPRIRTAWRRMPAGPAPPRAPGTTSRSVGSSAQSGDAAAMRSAVARAVPEGASTLPSWCSSMTSAVSNQGAAISAKRCISTAPMAKLGTIRQALDVKAASSAARSSSPRPLVPTTACTPAAASTPRLARLASATVKSTTTSTPTLSRSPMSSTRVTPETSAPGADGSAAATRTIPSAAVTASATIRPIRPAAPSTPTRIGFTDMR